eukprot:COSAG01_NODE_7761_length_3067_cov_2.317049_2_plen_48_part_00
MGDVLLWLLSDQLHNTRPAQRVHPTRKRSDDLLPISLVVVEVVDGGG